MKNDYHDMIRKSRSLYTAPYEVKNFISQHEIDICIKIWNELPVFESASHARATRKNFLMYPNTPDTRMQDIFLSKLQNLFPGKKILLDGGNFTEWFQPVRLHTDGYQFRYTSLNQIIENGSVLGYAVLVPLKTDSGKGRPTTIFFNQKCFGEEGNLDTIGHLKRQQMIEDLADQKFLCADPVLEQWLLSQHSTEILEGFSVDRILSWNPGAAIVWHRAQFHCAGRFLDYVSKTHLIFFVNFLPDSLDI